MSEDKNNLKIKNKEKSNISNSISKFYKYNKGKRTLCNCLCCKKCNIYWRPLKRDNINNINNPQKSIKFKKEFHCFKECLNCKKYIQKKEEQWKEYMATSGLEFDPITEQPKINNKQIDIDKDDKDTIIKKVKELSLSEFQPIKTPGDGNCMTRAILKSIDENEANHIELRQILMDYIKNTEYEEENTIFIEEKCSNKEEYIKKAREEGYYLSGIALETMVKKTNLIVGVYKSDKRYKEDPWSIITPTEGDIKGVILLYLEQGKSCQTGHYQGIKLFNKHNLGNISMDLFRKKAINLNDSNINMKDKTYLNVLIMNCRSIRDYLKRILLIDILRSKRIDVALLQETFLIKKDPLYFEGYKIYRDDNEMQRRKGTAILINTKLDVDIQRIAADPNGRFVKVRMTNRDDNNTITISSVYLEPNGDLEDINKIIFESDVIGGDMNNGNSGLNQTDVFHLKNIEIIDKIELEDNTIFDHPILLGKIKYGTCILNDESSILILNKKKTENNYKILLDITKGIDNTNKLIEPHKIIKVKEYEEMIDITKYGEEYAQTKKEIKEIYKEDLKRKYKNINAIITQNKLNIDNWYYINKTLIEKRTSKIWKTTANKYKIVEDYKKLFGHQENRKFEINKVLNKIDNILRILEINEDKFPKGYLYTPKSKALDYNGFNQRFLINVLKDNEPLNIFKKLRFLLEKLSENKGIEHFIHKNIRTILFKKKENADSQKELRSISILPAWLITLEKIVKPIINTLINNKITKSQFGFKEKSDCNLAKTMMHTIL